MKASFFICTIALTFVGFARIARAQDQDFRFSPPAAPSLDVDFGDDDDDEMGDFSRPPGAPAMPPGNENRGDARANGGPVGGPPGVINPNEIPPIPPGGFGGAAAMGFVPGSGYGTPGGNFGGTTTTAGKFRFKVVEGEFWHKGMKRPRGNETHVTGEDSRADGGPRRH